MTLPQRIDLLAQLGEYLSEAPDTELEAVIRRSSQENNWFTPDNIRSALAAIATQLLNRDKLNAWAAQYSIGSPLHPEKTVAVVMAGNIPLVGFHDWLCVFVAGHRALVKLSDKDKRLLPFLVAKLGDWEFESWEYTEFVGEADRLSGFDAVIATGSNNTSRYFEQYFAKYPHVIRHNRNGIAVLDGSESTADLFALGRDIFSYFGLGCRNVSKLYVPRGYNFEPLLEALHEYREIINHNKYKNNFDYNFTLYVLNAMPYMNNGCLLLREDPALSSRIASVHYEYYDNLSDLSRSIEAQKEEIQCVVGKAPLPGMAVLPFGTSQEPGLSDYPDGVDIMQFLTRL